MSESKTIDDGGFAFPQPETMQGNPIGCEVPNAGGLSLRDYFAAAAVQSVVCGIIADQNGRQDPQWLASTAYEIADAMLLARSRHATTEGKS